MSPIPRQSRRRTVLINPRFQIGAALLFTAVLVLGGTLFAVLIFQGVRDALRDASVQGHFRFDTPYQVVGDRVVRQLILLFSVVTLAWTAAFLLFVRRLRNGMTRLLEVLRMSGEGDLSTATNASGHRDLAVFGVQLDSGREYALDRIREIRAEVQLLRKEPLPPEEFQDRWDALKERIGRGTP